MWDITKTEVEGDLYVGQFGDCLSVFHEYKEGKELHELLFSNGTPHERLPGIWYREHGARHALARVDKKI